MTVHRPRRGCVEGSAAQWETSRPLGPAMYDWESGRARPQVEAIHQHFAEKVFL